MRDFGILLPNLLLILLFATPIFYPAEAVPFPFRSVVFLNPFFIISSAYRAVLLEGKNVPLFSLGILALLSGGLLVFALSSFRRVKGFFASVI
jgi:lipopolysaccharide transport system permease protein